MPTPRWFVGSPAALTAIFSCVVIVTFAVHFGLGPIMINAIKPVTVLDGALILVSGLAAGAVALGRIHATSSSSRMTWLLTAIGLCGLALSGATASIWDAASATEYPTICAWILTGFGLWLTLHFDAPPPGIQKFLHLGFALQTVSIFIDLADDDVLTLPNLSTALMSGGEEFLEALFLSAYCIGLILFAYYPLTSRSWKVLGFSALPAPVDQFAHRPAIDIIHQYYDYMQWSDSARGKRPPTTAIGIPWPVLVLGTAVYFTYKNARTIQMGAGKNAVRQFCEQITVAMRYAVTPSHYYMFELFDDSKRGRAQEYLLRHQTKGGVYQLLLDKPISPLKDKVRFVERCLAHGISVVPIIVACDRHGQIVFPAFGLPRLPHEDLFVKPISGKGGRGAERWNFVSPGLYRSSDSFVLSESALLQRLATLPSREGYVVQPRLRNHPTVATLTTSALATIRIMTCRDERANFEVTNAVLRMSRGTTSVVDNFHAGGLAAKVDVRTGVLGRATDLGFLAQTGWLDSHPDTSAQIRGHQLPFWKETVDLAQRAHAAFADRVLIGWDIALLPTGPCVIEGNSSPDLDIIQRTHESPLGNARLGTLIACALSNALPISRPS
jgi:hypothetical protein